MNNKFSLHNFSQKINEAKNNYESRFNEMAEIVGASIDEMGVLHLQLHSQKLNELNIKYEITMPLWERKKDE